MKTVQTPANKQTNNKFSFKQIRDLPRRFWLSKIMGDFRRQLLLDEDRLPLELGDICIDCPAHNAEKRKDTRLFRQQVDTCQKRYFATILRFYKGRAGNDEIDEMYGYLKSCWKCSGSNLNS